LDPYIAGYNIYLQSGEDALEPLVLSPYGLVLLWGRPHDLWSERSSILSYKQQPFIFLVLFNVTRCDAVRNLEVLMLFSKMYGQNNIIRPLSAHCLMNPK